MRGFPKNLNTKEDYEYVRTHFGEELWKPEWQKLLDTLHDWVPIGVLENADKGVTDDTHRVTCEDNDGKKIYTQWEYQEMPACKLYRLGFTIEEVKAKLGM